MQGTSSQDGRWKTFLQVESELQSLIWEWKRAELGCLKDFDLRISLKDEPLGPRFKSPIGIRILIVQKWKQNFLLFKQQDVGWYVSLTILNQAYTYQACPMCCSIATYCNFTTYSWYPITVCSIRFNGGSYKPLIWIRGSRSHRSKTQMEDQKARIPARKGRWH